METVGAAAGPQHRGSNQTILIHVPNCAAYYSNWAAYYLALTNI